MSADLDAWLYGTPIATFSPGTRDGAIHLTWTDEARDRWGIGSRVLSHLLPIPARTSTTPPARARVWLEGLLPEGDMLTHLAVDAGVDPDDTLGFLAHYGRDTAGALVLVPAGSPDPARDGTTAPVGDAEIGDMLRKARSRAGHGADRHDSLTSLAGLEPKIALARAEDGTWLKCLRGAPSTYILKVARPQDSATSDSVDTEAAALDLARRVGLTTIDAYVTEFDGQRCIVVSRYDRVARSTGTIDRIHQEDAAQGLGINTRDPARKAQHGKALPSLAATARILTDGGTDPTELLRLTTFNLAIGNTDAHAKNISFLRHADGTVRLAPAYDVAMHMHSPAASGLFAMDVNGTDQITEITATDLVDEAASWGMPRRRAIQAVHATLDALDGALDEIDRSAHPGVTTAAWNTVTTRTRELVGRAAAIAVPPRRRGASGRKHGTTQGRMPKGTPAGGRFTTTERPEPDTTP
ncbi:MAG: HipA domain-containing protein [Actinomycetales bacterium]|nr:HipA domain-containing protein [Actinomycetales bacterium]